MKDKFTGNITGVSLPGKKIKTISPAEKKYTLLFFSGSWCVPCKLVQPEFEDLYKKHRDKTTFIKIAVEKNIEDALTYYNNERPKWNFFYENISVKNPDDLGKKLHITTFPHFVLLDQDGKILFKGDSNDSLEPIRRIINSN